MDKRKENLKLIKTARAIRHLHFALNEIVVLNNLPLKLNFEILYDHENSNEYMFEALGAIILGKES